MENESKKVKPRICPFSILALFVLFLSTFAVQADMILGLFFVLVAGIIGYVSYTRIRRSEGKLYGKITVWAVMIIVSWLILGLIWSIINK